MAQRRLTRIVRDFDGRSGDDSADERRTSSRVDCLVECAIDEAHRDIVPDWGPPTLEESVIMRLRLAASFGPTTGSSEQDPDEIELCVGGWEIPDAARRFRSRSR